MKSTLLFILLGLLALALLFGMQAQAQEPPPIVVNHESVALFEQIPAEYLAAAQGMTMFYTDRSVGQNLNEALDCLAQPHATSFANCRVYNHVVPEFSTTPADVYWPGVYPRPDWRYLFCPTASSIACTLALQASTPAAVFGYFPSYLEGHNLLGAVETRFQPLLATETGRLIAFTSSLPRGTEPGAANERSLALVNDEIRAWAYANGVPLLDVANILSHTPDGMPCYDNRDGVAYDNGNRAEDYPDDGIETPAICLQYTTEVDGGHLGSVSAGKIRLAKAMWVLMAQVAGWQPGVEPGPTVEPTWTPEPTATSAPPTQACIRRITYMPEVIGRDGRLAVAMQVRAVAEHVPAPGVVVRGAINDVPLTCTTRSGGTCVMTTKLLQPVESVTYAVTEPEMCK